MVGQTARLIRTKLGTRPHLVLVQSSSRSAKTAVKTGMNAIGMRMEAPQGRVDSAGANAIHVNGANSVRLEDGDYC